ncbi:YceD family protein [Desmospora profundinema]|uniref:DUF177 domain-containing protein n=1 Tax=Desmospora profundinema TaxID=1571184 RepID=A0ABU1IR43_9BACL|nr:DUF177 domain-containing protein [Desmospora profundinema]MDR6227262.1 uncharacterized protein [Desmospora profundinema]
MKIRFRELHQQPVEQKGEVALEGLEQESPDLLSLQPLQVEILAWKDRETYQVQGKQRTEGRFRCSRCLTPFSQGLEMDWFQAFSDEERVVREAEEEGEEIRLVQLDRPTDLTPYIREALLLGLPLAPVCRLDCRGLCPVCGVNLNHESCDCDTGRVDPRLAKLQEFFKDRG